MLDRDSLLQRTVASLVATAILVIVTLAAVSTSQLDPPALQAVHLFVWAVVFFGGHLALDVVIPRLSTSAESAGHWVRAIWIVWFVVGATFWLQGAAALLAHFRFPPWQVTLCLAIFSVTLTVAAAVTRQTADVTGPWKSVALDLQQLRVVSSANLQAMQQWKVEMEKLVQSHEAMREQALEFKAERDALAQVHGEQPDAQAALAPKPGTGDEPTVEPART